MVVVTGAVVVVTGAVVVVPTTPPPPPVKPQVPSVVLPGVGKQKQTTPPLAVHSFEFWLHLPLQVPPPGPAVVVVVVVTGPAVVGVTGAAVVGVVAGHAPFVSFGFCLSCFFAAFFPNVRVWHTSGVPSQWQICFFLFFSALAW